MRASITTSTRNTNSASLARIRKPGAAPVRPCSVRGLTASTLEQRRRDVYVIDVHIAFEHSAASAASLRNDHDCSFCSSDDGSNSVDQHIQPSVAVRAELEPGNSARGGAQYNSRSPLHRNKGNEALGRYQSQSDRRAAS